MRISYQLDPVKYFSWTLLLTWATLFTSAYFSHHEHLAPYQAIFQLTGLLTPFLVAMFMIFGSGNPALKRDFKYRLLNVSLIKPAYWIVIFLLLPAVLLLSTSISLLFGQSAGQFALSPQLAATGSQAFTVLIILLLAPTFEELGWRGYGVDSLYQKGKNLFRATLAFGVLWNLWHLPLFFIKGYYHYELLQANILYALNFVVSLFPAVVLMNWLFYKNGRSIIAVILFHFMLNLTSSMLQTEQFTKIIITILLLVISGAVIWSNKQFFFETLSETPEKEMDIPEKMTHSTI